MTPELTRQATINTVAIAQRRGASEGSPVTKRVQGSGADRSPARATKAASAYVEDRIVQLLCSAKSVTSPSTSERRQADWLKAEELAQEVSGSPEETEALLARLEEEATRLLSSPSIQRKIDGMATALEEREMLSGHEAEVIFDCF